MQQENYMELHQSWWQPTKATPMLAEAKGRRRTKTVANGHIIWAHCHQTRHLKASIQYSITVCDTTSLFRNQIILPYLPWYLKKMRESEASLTILSPKLGCCVAFQVWVLMLAVATWYQTLKMGTGWGCLTFWEAETCRQKIDYGE